MLFTGRRGQKLFSTSVSVSSWRGSKVTALISFFVKIIFEVFRVSKRQISAGSFISSDVPSVYSTFKITGVSMPPRLLNSTR